MNELSSEYGPVHDVEKQEGDRVENLESQVDLVNDRHRENLAENARCCWFALFFRQLVILLQRQQNVPSRRVLKEAL